ncbi:MAG: hypothetical protein DMG42_36050, partial [Acidobacteria bacterium]
MRAIRKRARKNERLSRKLIALDFPILRRWPPRIELQVDAASGTDNPNGDTLGTFNPLFPSGFYEMLAGYPGYANFVHLRSSA